MAVTWKKIPYEGMSPSFLTVKCTSLTDGYIPYHVSDASGLANGPIYTDGTKVGIGGLDNGKFSVRGATSDNSAYALEALDSGGHTKFIVRNDGASWFYGADHLEKVRITETGNVGIGTVSPVSNLHVVGAQLRWDSSATSTDPGILFLTTDPSYAGIIAGQTGNYASPKNLSLNGLYGGNVGIGTTSPDAKLDVEVLRNYGVVDQDQIFISSTYSGGTATNPTSLGSIAWRITGYTLARQEYIVTNPASDWPGAMSFKLSNDGAAPTEKMRITSGGNVLIGATSAVGSGVLQANGISTVLNGNALHFYDSGNSNYVGFQAPALTANKVWTLPSTDGTAAYCLVTDGAGTLSWAENGSGAATDTFKTIDCPSGSDPVADSATDTLTLAASGGITITGDSGADSVTFDTSALVPKTLAENWDAGSYEIRAETFESDVATGTAPLTIASTTKVTNLNADQWDGYDFSDYLDQAVKTTSSPAFVTVKCSGLTGNRIPYHVSDATGLADTTTYYLAPSATPNVISDFVDTLTADGWCLMLGAGSFSQSEAIAIPTTVRNFSILGSGPGVTNIHFTADCDGIASQLGSMVVSATNKYIDFNEGGAEITATLTEGTYGAYDLIEEVVTQLNASGTSGQYVFTDGKCYASPVTGKFTLEKESGTFSLLWKTGTHGADGTDTSAAALLGFSDAADDTGSLSYLGDTATSTDIYRIKAATINGMTLLYDHSADSATKYGIKLWGDWTNDTVESCLRIRDVDIIIGDDAKFWQAGIRLYNAYNFEISDVYMRAGINYQAYSNATDGLRLDSVMNGTVSGLRVVGARYGVACTRASDHYIKNPTTKHGCEGTTLTNIITDYCSAGAYLGSKSLAIHIANSHFAVCDDFGIIDTDTGSDAGVGGYHSITNCYIDSNSSATASGHAILLQRAGTRVSNCVVMPEGAAWNGITLDGNADECIVSNNTIRDCGAGASQIWVRSSKNIIQGNYGQGATATFITFDTGESNNLAIGNIGDTAISDTGSTATKEHNIEY